MSTFHEMIAHNLHPSLSLSLSRRYYIPSHTRTEDESSRASIPGDVQRSLCRLIFSSVPDAKNMIGARRCSHGYVSAHAVEERRRRENRRFSVARGRTRRNEGWGGEGRKGGGRGAGTAERATGEEDKRERGIGEEPGHGLDENSNMNEGATRKRDGNARREAERKRRGESKERERNEDGGGQREDKEGGVKE